MQRTPHTINKKYRQGMEMNFAGSVIIKSYCILHTAYCILHTARRTMRRTTPCMTHRHWPVSCSGGHTFSLSWLSTDFCLQITTVSGAGKFSLSSFSLQIDTVFSRLTLLEAVVTGGFLLGFLICWLVCLFTELLVWRGRKRFFFF